MADQIPYAAIIDVGASYAELVAMIASGDASQFTRAVDAIAADHPAIAALVIVQGAQDRKLNVLHCNALANALIERRARAAGNTTF